jgi:two-component system phosphate regulon sensor histidine kinase PhoR
VNDAAPRAQRPPRRPHTRASTVGVWVLVAIPTILTFVCGVLILVYRKSVFDVVIGVLVVIFCAALGAGATLTIVGIQLDRRLAELQIDFVSKVSHELKTPLTSIRMFVETLKLGRVQDPDKVEYCLSVIAKETERLSELISRLLSWGAMESGAFRLNQEPRPPADVVQAAVDAFEPQMLRGEVQLEVRVDKDLPLIDADLPVLVDAILNLLGNAVRYGGTEKKIELSVSARSDNKIGIAVRDWGIGIEPRDQKRIFDRFYRADERYSRAVGGTGLGLAIAKHVVHAHGGTIEVKSRLGEGSTFTIVLPVSRAGRETAESSEALPTEARS